MGGKSKSVTTGYWYKVAYHHGLSATPIDAFLEFRCADKTAWSGEITASGTIHIDAPNLFGGEKDQGGITGDVDVMFGHPGQQPNPYLSSTFGAQQGAWLGVTTLVFKGGRFGANNPYPQRPAYKVRVIKMGWDDDPGDGSACWYPEKAEVPLIGGYIAMRGTGWEYQIEHFTEPNTVWSDWTIPTNGWLQGGELPFDTAGMAGGAYWTPTRSNIWLRRTIDIRAVGITMNIAADNGCVVFANGVQIGASNPTNAPIAGNQQYPVAYTPNITGTVQIAVKAFAEINASDEAGNIVDVSFTGSALRGMNPAHILYDALTSRDRGDEPTAKINDASFRTAADWFYAQGIGLCTELDPDAETVAQLIARIEKVAACSVSQSPVDGQWYLDIANGVYTLAELPILTDDDILEFSESPSTLDDVVNSLSVEYVDVEQKSTLTTPAAQALALVTANGVHHDVHQYHEAPTSDLAARFVQRDLQAIITPARAFSLTTTRKPFAWRLNTYFRLQVPKRGIADMVCLLAEKTSGTLKSGAMQITASENIYSMPTSSFVAVEPGVDTRPSQIPTAIVQQRAFEAPYIEVASTLSRADLAALPPDVGYLLTVAKDPARSLDYTIAVSSDGGAMYGGSATGEWCPTALIVEGDALTDATPRTAFTLSGANGLATVVVGSAALWGDEIVRVDAIDPGAGTLTLGRGCADAVAAKHDPGSRIWFYVGFEGADGVEYASGETINAKLLTNTGSQQLALAAATALPLTFAGRQARPYPPGNLVINDDPYPGVVSGDVVLEWSHRDRVAQADQLIDAAMTNIGPEPGTTYNVRVYGESDALLRESTGLGAGYVYTNDDEVTDNGGTIGDANWTAVKSLLNMDGAAGSASFTDATGRIWTASGDAKIDSSLGYNAAKFDGSGDYLSTPVSSDFDFGTGDFTIECWFLVNSLATQQTLFDDRSSDSSSGLAFYASSSGSLPTVRVYSASANRGLSPATLVTGAMVHAAYCVKAGVGTVYLNGAGGTPMTLPSGFSFPCLAAPRIGSQWNSSNFLNGFIRAFRATKGLARYSGSFAPPAAPFPVGLPTARLNGRLRFEIEAERDGLTSFQKHNVIVRRAGYGFNYGMYYGGHT